MKNRYKLSHEDFKFIETKALELPKLVSIKPDGTPLTRVVTITKKGSEFDDPKLDPNKVYYQNIQEPVWINHKSEMISRFWKGARPAVDAYIASVLAIQERYEQQQKQKQKQEGGENA